GRHVAWDIDEVAGGERFWRSAEREIVPARPEQFVEIRLANGQVAGTDRSDERGIAIIADNRKPLRRSRDGAAQAEMREAGETDDRAAHGVCSAPASRPSRRSRRLSHRSSERSLAKTSAQSLWKCLYSSTQV